MGIVKYHVDGRMLHGQTVAAWGKTVKADEYIVVNEAVANDKMQKNLLKIAAMGKELFVCSPVRAKRVIDENDFYGDRTMIIFKEIDDAAELIRLGHHIDELCLGGVYNVTGRNRDKYEMALFLNQHDIEQIKYIISQGTHVVYQVVPSYKIQELTDILKL